MSKPKRLKPGDDTMAVVTPPAGSAYRFTHVFIQGFVVLRNAFGFRIKDFPPARMSSVGLYDNPCEGVEDINASFADKEVVG